MFSATFLLATLISYRGTVVLPHDPATGFVGILDTSNHLHRTMLADPTIAARPVPGDVVEVSEDILYADEGIRFNRSVISLRVERHGPEPDFAPVSAAMLNRGDARGQLVSVTGTVHDIYRDDSDRRFVFAVIDAEGESILWASACGKEADDAIPTLIGAAVRVRGVSACDDNLARGNCGDHLWSVSLANLSVLTPPAREIFEAPDLGRLRNRRPAEIATQPRHRASGRVLAVWAPRSFLIRKSDGTFSTIQIAQGELPACDETVEAVGFPESNLYTLNLSRAFWRKLHGPTDTQAPTPLRCTIDELAPRATGGDEPYTKLHGQLLRIDGIVRRLPLADEPNGCALIEDRGQLLEVNPGSARGAFDGLETGSRIAVTGIAVLEKEGWRPNLYLPQVKKAMIVLRDREDIALLARPPFWTPARLLTVIILLVVAILVILLRNRTIQRLAEERIKERTRLAAELHDTIAQNLTGAAIQLETAEVLAADGSEKLKRILALAVKIMHISSEELRDCIWDLRNRTLDEKCLADALRRTLTPHLNGVQLRLRFPVSRVAVSDSSAHAAISIARELVANAIHHGHPTSIAIAGVLDSTLLKFSVTDDGCGFDTEHAPGSREGHFGLTGILERVRKLGGSFTLHSTPGQGTKATVTLPK